MAKQPDPAYVALATYLVRVVETIPGEDGMAVEITRSKAKPGTFNVTLRDQDADETVQGVVGVKTLEQARKVAHKMLNG